MAPVKHLRLEGKYLPHQGKRERERRMRQMARQPVLIPVRHVGDLVVHAETGQVVARKLGVVSSL